MSNNKPNPNPYFDAQLDYKIENGEIEKALKRLNRKASPGVDRISGGLLFEGLGDLLPIFNLFFNKLFSHALQPKKLYINYLITIFKKGEIDDPDNYRGIAIGSAVGKIFSLILLERLESVVQISHPISPNQIGFKKGHRTSDHIFVLKTIVDKIVKTEKKKLFVAFIDFRKAYDKINRMLLLLKLQRLGIQGLFYRNIKALYDSVMYQIKVKGGYLDPIPSKFGLKQGGILSPILFNLYIDDMKYIFDDTCDPVMCLSEPLSHLLYADDLMLISTTEIGLKNSLSKLEIYCNTWQLELNIKKCNVVIFNSTGRLLSGPRFTFQGKTIEMARSYCYLGLELTSGGSFKAARTNLMDKAKKAMFPLWSLLLQFKLPCLQAIKLFESLIRPIALYNAENLAHLTFREIESIRQNKISFLDHLNNSYSSVLHQRFLKFVLGVNKSCTNMATLGELGEFPLQLNGMIALLSFWHRISQMPEDTLVKQAYNISQEGEFQSEWNATVKFLIEYLNIENYFQNPSSVKKNQFVTVCKAKLKVKIVEQWKTYMSNIGNGSKLRFYKTFKDTFGRESYLDNISDFQLRKVITKFRCSDHSLEIEKGRHRKLNVEERICKLCLTDVETELHFLQSCPVYGSIRLQIFGDNTVQNWNDILKCEDRKSTHNLANFLVKAFKLRENLLALQNGEET
jgi:hypothetical protein